jgi:hypothetical protein
LPTMNPFKSESPGVSMNSGDYRRPTQWKKRRITSRKYKLARCSGLGKFRFALVYKKKKKKKSWKTLNAPISSYSVWSSSRREFYVILASFFCYSFILSFFLEVC